jgi:hypothetical protein
MIRATANPEDEEEIIPHTTLRLVQFYDLVP